MEQRGPAAHAGGWDAAMLLSFRGILVCPSFPSRHKNESKAREQPGYRTIILRSRTHNQGRGSGLLVTQRLQQGKLPCKFSFIVVIAGGIVTGTRGSH